MALTLEAREYGPDSSDEEVALLRSQVTLHGGFTLLFVGVPVGSIFQIDVCFDRMEELISEHDCHTVIFDLQIAGRPNAAFRVHLQNRFRALETQLSHIAIFTGKNVMMNVIIKFVMAGIPQKVTAHKTLAHAEEAVRSG